jgi:sigma-B regulation protein RsbU (phosphoserine phosphatase)
MPVVVAGALVLGGVNLLAWVASLERGEKELFRAELGIARDMQLALMPKSDPQVEGLDIAGMCVPAREVGGDLYEYVQLGESDGTFSVAVMDVSGKGMEAAMEAVFTIGAFTAEAKRSVSTAEILTRLNRTVVRRSRKGQFVAFLLLAVEPVTRTIRFCNAGQSKPFLRSGGTVRWIEGEGVHFPLGMQENTIYIERQLTVSSGDVLFLCTDGITDAMDAQRQLFGAERLEALVAGLDLRSLRATEILSHVTAAVGEFTGPAAQHDDMTMVVIRVL